MSNYAATTRTTCLRVCADATVTTRASVQRMAGHLRASLSSGSNPLIVGYTIRFRREPSMLLDDEHPAWPRSGSDRLTGMIAAQLRLQHSYGNHFDEWDDTRRVQWVKDMVLAGVKELFEALDETSWKVWTTGPVRFSREPFISELSDAFQFIMNLWF